MENSVDSYLHKKFKKQLSGVEATKTLSTSSSSPFYQYERETKKPFGIIVDSREEKSTNSECNQINDNQPVVDNNESVPNQSTNQISSSVVTSNFTKSSISIEECTAVIQSSNSCISFVDSKTYNADYTKANFDTMQTTTTSSILDNIYNSKTDNLSKEQDSPPDKSEQPIIEKSPAGKYVCTYCNLVCSKPSVLQKHIRAHTNERPYPCSSCGFSFKTRSNLYKHCRSRTHANRVMGNKVQEIHNESIESSIEAKSPLSSSNEPMDDKLVDLKAKPYKPRFHTFNSATIKENIEQEKNEDPAKINNTNLLSDHINDIISKNNSIVNSSDTYFLKKRNNDVLENHNEPYVQRSIADFLFTSEEPLNLTNKNRKRSMSEVVEPIVQKSLIKELLLKNLNSDMQCPHCKMIFQTVTELELHKLRSCKGFVKPGAKYTRSSSVNVASILTQNKNAFDNIPHMQNSVFPLKSPGPFLGKTRLVESDKNKSFSFDDGLPTVFPPITASDRFLLSPLTLPSEKEKKIPVKLFGGEVKITQTTGETKSFKIDSKEGDKFEVEFSGKISENRVVKSGLQSGGTVLTNKANYTKQDGQDIIRMYDTTPGSPNIDLTNLSKQQMNYNRQNSDALGNNDLIISTQEQFNNNGSSYKYTNIMDFSQKAVNLLTPNLKKINITIPGTQHNKFIFPPITEENDKMLDLGKPEPQNLTTTQKVFQPKVVPVPPIQANSSHNPMQMLVNGKVVRYVPGIPGPVATEEPMETSYPINRSFPKKILPLNRRSPNKMEMLEIKTDFSSFKPDLKPIEKSPVKISVLAETKKFSRPNSLALKPTTASLKQHHGLTPTKFNQILISPDTPRVAKKYVQQFLHGNYFSYLGLKSSTKPVYCTLNKTQPFYVPHFKKLSMYSEWRQQDTKTEKLFVSGYDSRQCHRRFTTAGKISADLVVHSSYKFVVSETLPSGKKGEQEQQKPNSILGGYECNDDYTYIRGRGRGRYVCDQCGIRCKKPSMLKKHIRTHSNDRPYTCSHCNFSFKTKGNLTKHMKSKAHTKNYAANGSGSSTQQSGTQSSDSETDDSGMDSSDESTRREEHEAAYGLLSLSQKTSRNLQRETNSPSSSSGSPVNMINAEEIGHISKGVYVKNKILDDNNFPVNLASSKMATTVSSASDDEIENITHFLGRATINRPLTYPYTTILPPEAQSSDENAKRDDEDRLEPKCIKQFHVIQKYAPVNKLQESPKIVNSEKVMNNVINKGVQSERTRVLIQENNEVQLLNTNHLQTPPVLKVNDSLVISDNQNTISDLRKRKLSFVEPEYDNVKHVKPDEVMDLSMATEKNQELRFNGTSRLDLDSYHPKKDEVVVYPPQQKELNNAPLKNNNNFIVLQPVQNDLNINYVIQDPHESPKSYKSVDFDNSAMETLADIATKQVKLEKNTLAKSVASEYLKIATKNEFSNSGDLVRDSNAYGPVTKEVNDLIVKPEGNKSCHICAKSFSKASQLRLHMNIHYLERPFRCHSCSVSFRTKGHLQKHERSASHHNKLSSSPALSSSEPRPFKCIDCNIAFRIHGHLAKHLRSKMHIMKLECLAKIPFGLYAELERSNSLLTEINTADGDQCLESLKTLAKKVFINDPNKLNQLGNTETLETDS